MTKMTWSKHSLKRRTGEGGKKRENSRRGEEKIKNERKRVRIPVAKIIASQSNPGDVSVVVYQLEWRHTKR